MRNPEYAAAHAELDQAEEKMNKHKKAITNLGRDVRRLVVFYNGTSLDDFQLGLMFDGFLDAALDGAIPGRQKDAQTDPELTKARKAFNRALARRVKSL